MGHLPSVDLRLDDLLQGTAVVVDVLARLEPVRHRIDVRGGHLHLLRTDVHVVVEEGEFRPAYLVRPQHRLHDEDALSGTQYGEPLPLPQRHLDDRDPVTLLERVAQEHVRLGVPGRFGVVGLGQSGRVDFGEGHEREHVHGPGRRYRQLGEVGVVQDDHVTVGELVALGDLRVRHLTAVGLAHPAVADPPPVDGVHLPERDVALLRGTDQPHGNRYEAEGDRPFPHGLHGPPSIRLRRA